MCHNSLRPVTTEAAKKLTATATTAIYISRSPGFQSVHSSDLNSGLSCHLKTWTWIPITLYFFWCAVYCIFNPSEGRSLVTIVDTVHTLTAKWFNFGLELGLSFNVLSQIEHDHPRDSLRCLTEVITRWLHNNPQSSWRGLASALSSPSMGELRLAANIAKDHPSH